MLRPHPGERIVHSISALCCALALSLHSPSALAGPEGEVVIEGSAEFSRNGSLTTIETSHEAIIDYQRFNIGHDETVRFVQPDVTSRVLNRILGNDPTQIDGSLLANGQVYFLNPAGIFVGANALIDVAGIYAAAGSLSNEDFRAGIDRFTELQGPVENLGTIQAGRVHLIGRQVANYGSIVARGGIVTLLAGEDVYIVETGGSVMIKLEGAAASPEDGDARLEQSGSIDASGGQVFLKAGDLYSLALGAPGTTRASEILLEAGDGSVVNVAGMLDASDAAPGATGGEIEVLGDRIALVGAELDASGDAGGGTVHVGGGRHGEGATRSASGTFISSDSEIRADALVAGDGGEIVVWSDGATRSYGSLSARGGANGGDGGLVETSGRLTLDVGENAPDLSAPAGHGGTWELDPGDITIVDVASGTPLEPDFSISTSPSTITDDVIEAALNAGTNVTISTTFPSGTAQGNIVQNADAGIEKTAGALASLTLRAANDIQLNGGITAEASAAGGLNVTLAADGVPGDDPAPGTGTLTVNAAITTRGGILQADAGTEIDLNATIDTGGGRALIGRVSAGQILLASNISTSGGQLDLGSDATLDGVGTQSLDAGATGPIIARGSLTKTSAGDLNLAGGGGIQLDGDVAVQQGSLTATDPVLVGGSELTASGDILIEDFLSAQNTAVRAGQDLTILGSVTATSLEAQAGSIEIDGFARLSGALSADDSILVGDVVEGATFISAREGSIEIDGPAEAIAGNISAGTNIDILDSVTVSGDLVARDEDILIGEFASVGGSIQAGTDISIEGSDQSTVGLDMIAALGYVNVDGPIQIGGSIDAGTDIFLNAGANVAGSVIADLDIELTEGVDNQGGVIPLIIGGAIDAGGDVIIDAIDGGLQAGSIRAEGFFGVEITGTATIAGDLAATEFFIEETQVGGNLIALTNDLDVLDFDSPLTVTGDLVTDLGDLFLAESDVEVGGNIRSGGDLFIEGDFSFAGDVTAAGELESSGSATIGGDLVAGTGFFIGETEVGGDLVLVSGDLDLGFDFDESVTVVGDLVAEQGDITLSESSVTVGGDIRAGNDVIVEDIFSFDQSIRAGNSVSVDSDLTLGGDLTAASGDIDAVFGAVRVDGHVSAGGDVVLENGAVVGGDIVAAGEISLAEGFDDDGFFVRVQIQGSVTSDGDGIAVEDDLLVGGDLRAAGDIELLGFENTINGEIVSSGGGFVADGELLAGASVLAAQTIEFGDDAVISGGVESISGDVVAEGDLEIGDGLVSGGNIELGGETTVGGDLVLRSPLSATLTIGDAVQVDGKLTATQDLVVILEDVLTVDGMIEADGRVDLEGAGFATAGGLRATTVGITDAAVQISAPELPESPSENGTQDGAPDLGDPADLGRIRVQDLTVDGGFLFGAEELIASGKVEVKREGIGEIDLSGGRVEAQGGITVTGALRADSITTGENGDIDIASAGGEIEANSIHAGRNLDSLGVLNVAGDITIAGDASLAGITILGGAEAQRIAAEGSIGTSRTLGEATRSGRILKTGAGDLTLAGSELHLDRPADEEGVPVAVVDVAGGSLIIDGPLETAGELRASEDVILLSEAELGAAVTAGRDIRIDQELRTAANVTAGRDVLIQGAAEINADVLGARDVSFGSSVVLRGETAPAVPTDAPGPLDQTLAAGGVLSVHDVTKETDGELRLEGASIEFASRVSAADDLRLVASGPSTRADGATLFKEAGDLTLSAGDELRMEPGGSLFVGGDLLVEARSVELGDISTDGTLTIDAEEIAVVSPRASDTNGFETKEGFQRVNFFGDTIGFDSAPVEGNPIFGTPEGRGGLTGDPLVAFDVIITGGTLASSGEPSPETTGQDIVNKEKVELSSTDPPGPIIVAQLAGVASQRPLWADELVSYLDCAALADCAPGTPSITNDSRLRTAEVQMLVVRYRSIYKNLGAVRDALGSAIDAFEEQHPDEPVAGLAFRSFLEADETHAVALESVRELGELRSELDRLALSPPQVTDAWLQLLEKLDVPGISLGELDQAIRPKGTELGGGPNSGRVASSASASASGPWRP